MTIWVFYNRQGEWGLRLNGKYTICKTLDIRIRMRGRMRAGASPNAYLAGEGVVDWSEDGKHAVLLPRRTNNRKRR